MDPITLITSAPTEFVPWLILVAMAIKAWQWWILRNADDDNNPSVG